MELLLAAFVLAACANVPAPKGVDQSLAYGVGVVASARGVAANALDRGRISVAQARDVQAKADTARAGLDLAHAALVTGNRARAQLELDAVQKLLEELDGFVKTWEAK